MRLRTSVVLLLGLALAPMALADDHSNAWSSATPVTIGTGVAGSLETSNDVDWFTVQVPAGAALRFRTTDLSSSCDTLLDLYGVDGRLVARDDDSGGGYASAVAYTAPAAGRCWFAVRHYSQTGRGTYRVLVEGPAPAPTPTPTPTPAPTPPPPTPAPSTGAGTIVAAPVFDPKLEGASLRITSRPAGLTAYTATLRIVDAQGRVVATLAAGASRQGGVDAVDGWDGRDGNGLFVAPGAYAARLEVARPNEAPVVLERAVRVVRLGVITLTFDDAGAGGTRVPLVFHAAQRMAVDSAGAAWALPRSTLGDGCLDRADGAPLDLPARWLDTDRPPRQANGTVATRGRSLPVAYTLGARPHVRARLGERAVAGGGSVDCGYPVASTPIRLVARGGGASAEVAPGAEVALELPALPAVVGRHDLDVELGFEAWSGGAWVAVPGRHVVALRAYTVVARPPAWAAARAWTAAVDVATRYAAGATSAAGVVEGVTRGVNQSGLRYDVQLGASAYSGGWDLANPDYDLESFLARANGQVVNCLDCASSVSTLAAHAGADTQVAIMGDNFALHWLRGIGGAQFIHDLFGGFHAFSYHAVVTADAGQSVSDACLSVDDDSRPDRSPFVERLPVAMPWARYKQQLSPGSPRINDLGHAASQ